MIGRSPPKTTPSPLHKSEPDLTTGSDTNENITQRKRKRGDDSDLHRMENMIMEMKAMFSQMVSQQALQNLKIDSLHSALDNIKTQNTLISTQNLEIQTQNEEIKKTVQFLSEKYDDAVLEISQLQSKCTNNNKLIKSLELKVDFLEKNLKSASIEIRNIPTSVPENRDTLSNTVQKLGEVINQPIENKDIKTIFRSLAKKESLGTILVEFSSSTIRDQFLKSTRTFNRDNKSNRLNTTHLQLIGPEKPIFVAEALTTMTKRLHYLAREFIKSSNYEQCWIANGKVYVREKEGMPSRLIKTEEDLIKLRKQK